MKGGSRAGTWAASSAATLFMAGLSTNWKLFTLSSGLRHWQDFSVMSPRDKKAVTSFLLAALNLARSSRVRVLTMSKGSQSGARVSGDQWTLGNCVQIVLMCPRVLFWCAWRWAAWWFPAYYQRGPLPCRWQNSRCAGPASLIRMTVLGLEVWAWRTIEQLSGCGNLEGPDVPAVPPPRALLLRYHRTRPFSFREAFHKFQSYFSSRIFGILRFWGFCVLPLSCWFCSEFRCS